MQIAAASGVLSLWDGWAPNVQRSFIVNAAELATCAAVTVVPR
jgi:hypothetical protein